MSIAYVIFRVVSLFWKEQMSQLDGVVYVTQGRGTSGRENTECERVTLFQVWDFEFEAIYGSSTFVFIYNRVCI